MTFEGPSVTSHPSPERKYVPPMRIPEQRPAEIRYLPRVVAGETTVVGRALAEDKRTIGQRMADKDRWPNMINDQDHPGWQEAEQEKERRKADPRYEEYVTEFKRLADVQSKEIAQVCNGLKNEIANKQLTKQTFETYKFVFKAKLEYLKDRLWGYAETHIAKDDRVDEKNKIMDAIASVSEAEFEASRYFANMETEAHKQDPSLPMREMPKKLEDRSPSTYLMKDLLKRDTSPEPSTTYSRSPWAEPQPSPELKKPQKKSVWSKLAFWRK